MAAEAGTEMKVPCDTTETTEPSIVGKCLCKFEGIGNIFFPKRKKRTDRIKKQALPYGLSKYVIICMGCVSICLTSSLYYNWTIFEDMFMRDKILSGLCTEEEIKTATDGTFVCDAQRRGISNLYSAIMYTDSFMGIIGGYIGDRFGAFYALLTGQIAGVIAFVMFHLFSYSTIMLYLTFFFWGISCSFALAPCWHYSRMFTFGNNMAVSVITAADNLSMFTPTIVEKIAYRFKIGFTGSALTYIFWAILVSISVTLYFIPKRFIVLDEEDSEEAQSLSDMFNESFAKAVKDVRYWLSVTCYILLCSVRLFYRRSFSLLFFDNEAVITFLEEASDLSFVGSFILGYMNEYFGVVTMMGITTTMYIGALCAVYFRNFPCAYTSALLFAIAQAGDIQQLITFIDEVFPEHESTLMGVANIANTIFGLLLQVVFNYIFDLCGPRITVFLMILILGGVLVICSIIEMGMRKESEEKEECDKNESVEGPEGKEPLAEEEDTAYNPFGSDILLSNILSVILSLPYYLSLCTAVGINNIGHDNHESRNTEQGCRKVYTLERDQFYMSSNRIVELCTTVFYTSLIILLGCIFEYSRNNQHVATNKSILVLMACLICPAVVASLALPFTKLFTVLPPIVAIGLTTVPPLGFVILGLCNPSPSLCFTLMCCLVGFEGFILFIAGNMMLYMNALMGGRFGKSIHSLLGWSNLGMGYFYTLLLMYTLKTLYTGGGVLGGYVIAMAMQVAISLFATVVVTLHLTNEKQYFCCKKDDSKKCLAIEPKDTKVSIQCPDLQSANKDHIASSTGTAALKEECTLYFLSQYSEKYAGIAHEDYGLWSMNYTTPSFIKPSYEMALLAMSVAISVSDATVVFVARPFLVLAGLLTIAPYFLIRLLFMFFDDKIAEWPKTGISWIGYMRSGLFVIIFALFVTSEFLLKWCTGETIEKGVLIAFCILYGIRMWLNAFLQHHLLSSLENFTIEGLTCKNEYAHNTVMYMNIGHCCGLIALTCVCYLYFH
ncbi:uncharacterized protein BXIN_1083 [Babesia sp. Xinjiang]|uniref:uncharacterized protein n=1 Tax=Babesia sp. Xinjiang TaxID=462227 RepID=UPI000A21FD4D|nr:uncharacterized protein BXIN_1083 [Babesia sp. Xinjiang]ORM42283.1 hypothetical protein BXIN_1083 [Babesia sp. Xinjiang]